MVRFSTPGQADADSLGKVNRPKVENITLQNFKKPQCVHSHKHRGSCVGTYHLGVESKVMFELKPNAQMTVRASRVTHLFPKINLFLILSVLCYFLITMKNLNSQIDELKYDITSLKHSSSKNFDNIDSMKLKMMKMSDQIFNLKLEHQGKLKNFGERLPSMAGEMTNESKLPKDQVNIMPSIMSNEIPSKRLNFPKIYTKLSVLPPEKVSPQKLALFANILKDGMSIGNKAVKEADQSKKQADARASSNEIRADATKAPSVDTVHPEANKAQQVFGERDVFPGNEGYESVLRPSSGSTGRAKRSNGRGNVNSRKHGERQNFPKTSKNHKRKERKGILAAHFQGAVPEIVPRDEGLIAPWFLDEKVSDAYSLTRFVLRDGNGSVQVTEDGLYFIYAQAYYITNETLNSFTINLRSADKESVPIASCSASAYLRTALDLSEISCFTATVRFLNTNEVIFLRQREFRRHLVMKEGHTFLGLVRLQSSKPKPRPQ